MRRLLVPIDGSETATRALEHAIGLAKADPSIELHLVNAHALPVVYGEIAVYAEEEKIKALQRRHSEDILKPAIGAAKAAGVNVVSDILVGDVASSLAQYAEAKGCDGIVMGTRGMTAIGNLLLGSVATKVLHLTRLPVTLVK
jgi:nucleotide-binding universal stress UspA family protein